MNCEFHVQSPSKLQNLDYKKAILLYEPVVGDTPECMEFILDLKHDELIAIYDWVKNPIDDFALYVRILSDSGDILKTIIAFNCKPIALVIDDCFNKLVVQYSKANEK
jgi:hypothetical protein